MSERSVDFDSPWKETLAYYFEDFMAFFFQQAYANIDWSRGYEFLDKSFGQQVHEFEKERQMPYISSVERMATQEGLEQGRQEGMLLSLLHLLQYRFGPASEELQTRLQQFSAEQLTMLLDVALTTNSTAEFTAQLPSVLDAKPETQNQAQI